MSNSNILKISKFTLTIMILLLMLLNSSVVRVFAQGCSNIETQVIDYYKGESKIDISNDIAEIGEKNALNANGNPIIPGCVANGTCKYSITYVTYAGDECNVYLKKIPDGWGIWNADIEIVQGRVVVEGLDNDDERMWNTIYEKYHNIIVGVSGLGALTCILAFIIGFIKLGSAAGNPTERRKYVILILWTGIGAAGLGAITLIFSFFWNAI